MTIQRRVGLPIVALALVVGCAESPPIRSPEAILGEFSARLDDIRQRWNAETVTTECKSPPRPGHCGLLWDQLQAGGYIERFVREKCQEEDPSHVSDECVALFRETFRTALRRTYTRAVEADVLGLCANEPKHCATFKLEELQWLISHDEHVNAYYGGLADEAVRQHAQAQDAAASARQAEAEAAERRRRVLNGIAAGLSGFSAGMNGTAQQAAPSNSDCTSDYQCGPGQVCVKPPYQVAGSCARAVTSYGVQDFSAPRPSSVGPGRADCGFGTGCPVMFQCIQGHCMRQ